MLNNGKWVRASDAYKKVLDSFMVEIKDEKLEVPSMTPYLFGGYNRAGKFQRVMMEEYGFIDNWTPF